MMYQSLAPSQREQSFQRRRRVDHKRTAASAGKLKMREMPMAEWIVLQQDRLPAYITWER